jgi:co-chaperonin GroES (HSP10)
MGIVTDTSMTIDIMDYLSDGETHNLASIAARLDISVATLIPFINILENQGLISAGVAGGWAPDPKDTRVQMIKQKVQSACILNPLPGRCVVEREGFKAKTSIIIPGEAKRTPTIGVVVAVGDSDEYHQAMVGRRVLFARMSGVPIYMSGHPQYDIFDYSELLAFVNSTDKIEFVPEGEIPLYREE